MNREGRGGGGRRTGMRGRGKGGRGGREGG